MRSAEVPQHPFVPFAEYTHTIAEKYIRSPRKRRLFLSLTRSWYSFFGIAPLEEEIRDRFASGENGFLIEYKRFYPVFHPEFSATFLLDEKSAEDPARKASKLIYSALAFRERLLRKELKPDFEGNHPLDMQGYSFFFSRLGRPSLIGGQPQYEIVDVASSDYIVIAVRGFYYRLPVLDGQRILSLPELHAQVAAIISDAKSQSAAASAQQLPLGLLTVLINKKSIRLLDKLIGLSHPSIELLNNALFFIAIDVDDASDSLEKTGRLIQWQNYANRDYRRSMQIVVTNNGHAGIIINPNAGLGGGFTARLLSELAKEGAALDTAQPLAGVAGGERRFTGIDLRCPISASTGRQLATLRKELFSRTYADEHNTVFRLDGIGKQDFLKLAASPDGVFHAALHLTFQRCFGKVPEIGNFIGLRSVQHGGIFRYNSSTAEMQQFVSAPTAQNLAAALRKHKQLVKEMKLGKNELYQCSMMVATLLFRRRISIAAGLSLIILLSLFIERFNRRLMNQDIWVSHIPELPDVALTGRPGVKLSFLKRPSLAGHYMIFDDHIMICFVTNPGLPSYYGKEATFAAALRDTLQELHGLLEQANQNASRQGTS